MIIYTSIVDSQGVQAVFAALSRRWDASGTTTVSCFDELLGLEGRYPRSHSIEDAYVNSSPNSDIDSAVSKIAALREAWIAAVKASDADRLSSMVTDDVVVIHGNGRCVCG